MSLKSLIKDKAILDIKIKKERVRLIRSMVNNMTHIEPKIKSLKAELEHNIWLLNTDAVVFDELLDAIEELLIN